MMAGRIHCVIPGCTHSMGLTTAWKRFKHIPSEWICSTHWQRLSRAERRVWNRHRRELRKYGFFPRDGAADRIWSAAKRKCA